MNPKLSLSFTHLQHFLAVADQGSVRAAAEALGLSQPAVSKSLRSLETALGAPLIQRTARGSTLTPSGKLLYSRARLIENEIQRASEEIRDLTGASAGHISIGASAIPSLLLLPQAVEQIRGRHRNITIDVMGGMPSVLLPRLIEGSLDFVVGPRPAARLPAQIQTTPLFELCGSIVVRRGHPLEKANSIEQFKDAEWVLSSAAAHAESALHAAFKDNDLANAKVAVRVESLLAAYSIVAETQYAGLLPNYTTAENTLFNKVSFPRVPQLSLIDHYDLFVRSDVRLSTAATRAIAIVRSLAGKLKIRM